MKKIKDILLNLGFYDIPNEFGKKLVSEDDFRFWNENIDFDEAVKFYGLCRHSRFMELFQAYLDLYNKSPEMQYAVCVLNKYLFDADKYNWERYFNRDVPDMLAAVILLSGYKKHLANMRMKKFDSAQIEAHKHRISECCTIGFDVYGLSYMQTSQLKWGTLFINAHIFEIGRLQFEVEKYEYQLENFEMKDRFCVEIHIPRGGKLDSAAVDVAIKNAKMTLPEVYKELPQNPKFFLFSWLLSKEVEELLPPESNIKSFYRRFDIVKSYNSCSLNHFLFDKYDWDINKFPEDTSLRRIIKQELLSGKQFHDAVGILR